MMADWRNTPPRFFAGSSVARIRVYSTGEDCDLTTGKVTPIEMERSNVLQFVPADKTVVSVRPSGTEPKIKFYFGVCAPLCCVDKFYEVQEQLDAKIEAIKKEMGLA